MADNFPDFLEDDATTVAKKLLGCYFERQIDNKTVRVKIVETESYDQSDAASHSARGEKPRTKVMFGPSGHLYVYFTYGMHYCCNVVTGQVGEGSGVLIRAVEPIDSVDLLEARRGKSGPETTNGPAKLCQALGIDLNLGGHDLRKPPFKLMLGESIDESDIATTKRIGITKARDELRRFYIRSNKYVSKY